MAYLLPALIKSIISLCYRIHEEGGPLLSFEDYIESVKDELNHRYLSYRQNEIIDLEYLGKLVDRHPVEFIIEEKILLDLKGRELLRHPIFYKQLTLYLMKKNLPLAFVVDFSSRLLKLRKVVNPNFNYQI